MFLFWDHSQGWHCKPQAWTEVRVNITLPLISFNCILPFLISLPPTKKISRHYYRKYTQVINHVFALTWLVFIRVKDLQDLPPECIMLLKHRNSCNTKFCQKKTQQNTTKVTTNCLSVGQKNVHKNMFEGQIKPQILIRQNQQFKPKRTQDF